MKTLPQTSSDPELWQTLIRALKPCKISTLELRRACGGKLSGRLSRKVILWLNRPNPQFGGRTPIEVAKHGAQDRVLYELRNVATGINRVIERHLRPFLLAPGTDAAKFMAECRHYRRKAGLTINELAAQADVPAGTIRRLEKGDIRWLRIAQLQRLAPPIGWRTPWLRQKLSSNPG